MMNVKKVIAIIAVIALMACVFTGCGKKELAEPTIPACKEGMEHDWTITVFRKVSCLENGLEKHVCKNCEYTEHVSVDALGHNFVNDESGVTMCEHCGLMENPEAILDETVPSTEPLIPIE